MALVPNSNYPAQTAVPGDGSYPLGKARNVTTVNDGSGTPLEQAWVNDIWGFLQALLSAASITPSGAPDTALVSQYLGALRALFLGIAGGTITGDLTLNGATIFQGQARFNSYICSAAALYTTSSTIDSGVSVAISNLGSGGVLTLNTNIPEGARILILNKSTANSMIVKCNGTGIAMLPAQTGYNPYWVEFLSNGDGTWTSLGSVGRVS
jgi:hypothetical protein